MPDDLAALRDRLAGLCGWERQTGCWSEWESDKSYVVFNERWVRGSERTYFDPFKPGDLTALAAAWPEGWCIGIEQDDDGRWYVDASRDGELLDPVVVAFTEYEARLRLTVAVREAMASDPA